ncbi:MAG: glycosyltransferase [Alphaproteobacteria bacterium]|nr:glycosyltransferase [Alphaproteobacteria bacterium]
MRIVMADSGVAFDGLTPQERPLGGAESAFVALAEALAAEGAEVAAYSREARPMTLADVRWRPNETLANERATRDLDCDLYIANRDPSLLRVPIQPKRTIYWLHNPASFLSKPRFAAPLLRKRPALVFAGPSHLGTAPGWTAMLERVCIPLGVENVFLQTPRVPGVPPPRAIFASNPVRGLAELADIWTRSIHPALPEAELHVFAGPAVYGADGKRAAAMRAALEAAARAPGVVLRDPVPKAALARELGQARAMAYLGDPGETFCLAVAEAQAMGVPAIVRPVGAVGERVERGVTGAIEDETDMFSAMLLRALGDDALWRRWSDAALARRDTLDWRVAARAFMALAQSSAAQLPDAARPPS